IKPNVCRRRRAQARSNAFDAPSRLKIAHERAADAFALIGWVASKYGQVPTWRRNESSLMRFDMSDKMFKSGNGFLADQPVQRRKAGFHHLFEGRFANRKPPSK